MGYADGGDHGRRGARLPRLQHRLPRGPVREGRGLHGGADPGDRRPRVPRFTGRPLLSDRESRSGPRKSSRRSCAPRDVDTVVLSYSDLRHEDVMHKASRVLAAGADFMLLGPNATMLEASKPVVAVTAVRTGFGKEPDEPSDRLRAHRRRPARGARPSSDAVRRPRRRCASSASRPSRRSTPRIPPSRSGRSTRIRSRWV